MLDIIYVVLLCNHAECKSFGVTEKCDRVNTTADSPWKNNVCEAIRLKPELQQRHKDLWDVRHMKCLLMTDTRDE